MTTADDQSIERERLRQCFAGFIELERPRNRGLLELGEIDVDLYVEDSYLAGMVSTFLDDGSIPEGMVPLNPEIDSLLAEGEAAPGAEALLQAFKAYRSRMKELATALSHAARVPVVYRHPMA